VGPKQPPLVLAVLLREELHGLMNPGERTAGHVEIPGHARARGQEHGVEGPA